MWPNGVALVSEAWSKLSRPVVAGVIGTAANFGIAFLGWLATEVEIDTDHWRWVLLVGATPVVLGVLVLAIVPESPRWLETRGRAVVTSAAAPVSEVLRPPLLRITIIGILLGTIPLMGGWGSANWVMPWAGQVGEQLDPPDPELKARLQLARSITSIAGALLGGLIASVVGRRRTYFLTSLGALACAQLLFWFVDPASLGFLLLFGALGFFNGVYFGWLPYCLPEMFPTRVRSTGAGVSFNWGRILTLVSVLVSGYLLGVFGGYAELGRLTSLIFAVGMVVIWFAPDTSRSKLED
jgi:MFS family permease